MKVLVALIALIMASSGAAIAASKPPMASGTPQTFATQSTAQAHCPKDEIVWLNTASGVYHEQGMRWYGKTKQGA